MADTAVVAPTPQPRRALRFEWLLPVLIRPRKAFGEIAAQTRGVWLAPLLILTVAALMYTLMAGSINQAAAASGEIELPPDFMYYTPEQQAQFEQARAGMQSPVIMYVIPSLVVLAGVWLGWLVLGGLLHLMLTLLGGRSSTSVTMNIVAWASLPIAVRYLIQFVFMLITRELVPGQGLSGFITAEEGALAAIARTVLALVDVYVIWQIVLLVIGVRASSALTRGRAILSVLLTFGVLFLFQAAVGFAGSLLSNLTAIQPFF